jgi:hypothetical protein
MHAHALNNFSARLLIHVDLVGSILCRTLSQVVKTVPEQPHGATLRRPDTLSEEQLVGMLISKQNSAWDKAARKRYAGRFCGRLAGCQGAMGMARDEPGSSSRYDVDSRGIRAWGWASNGTHSNRRVNTSPQSAVGVL